MCVCVCPRVCEIVRRRAGMHAHTHYNHYYYCAAGKNCAETAKVFGMVVAWWHACHTQCAPKTRAHAGETARIHLNGRRPLKCQQENSRILGDGNDTTKKNKRNQTFPPSDKTIHTFLVAYMVIKCRRIGCVSALRVYILISGAALSACVRARQATQCCLSVCPHPNDVHRPP